MSEIIPKITRLQPIVLPDKRRVSLEMVVENLPSSASNIMLTMPDTLDTAPTAPRKPNPDEPSPYPNISLSILNSRRQEVAHLFIVEHKEPQTALTLHLRTPELEEHYTARAEMTHNEQVLDVVEVAFSLSA